MAAESPSLIFEQIRFLSDRFARDRRQGKAPKIETYLQQVPDASQTTLLRNLLLVELHDRRNQEDRPQLNEYLDRFPEYRAAVQQVFSSPVTLCTTGGDGLGDTSLEFGALQSTDSFAIPLGQLGSYQLVGELGRGGFGIVWEAEHVEQRYRVALKTLPSDLQDRLDSHRAADRLHRFREEFRRLHDVNHPNLVGMHNLECDGLQWYFTMDLVKGVNFLAYVRPGGVLDLDRLRPAFAQLVAGIAELHERRIVHRDLKPSNVMVSHEGRVVILDFGLVVDLDRSTESHSRANFVGTPAYAAPEQLGSEPSAVSDWYAAGVMLYQALTGKLPFSASDAFALMRAKWEHDPDPITDEALPEDLVTLAFSLLRREADQRPQATALLHQFQVDPLPQAFSGQQLIGRQSQLAVLRAACEQVESRGAAETVFVSGRSGEGKSALVEHFLEPLHTDPRYTVLEGRCYDRTSVPFKALDNLIDSLCAYLRRLGDEAAFLIPDDIGFLASLFPVMKRVGAVGKTLAVQQYTQVDEQQRRQRAFAALRELLQRLGRRHTTIVFVDDLQWGDKDSAEALWDVLRAPESPRVLVVGSYRGDEVEESLFLQEWSRRREAHPERLPQRAVEVGVLDSEQCHQLIAAECGAVDLDEGKLEQLLLESGRNPYLLVELLGCLEAAPESFGEIPLSQVIARKLARLPSVAGVLLEIVAVSGKALDLAELARTIGVKDQAATVVTRMRNEKLLRFAGNHEDFIVDTYHDRVRETVLKNLSPAAAQQHHLRLAESIEATGTPLTEEQLEQIRRGELPAKTGSRVFDLAYHFDGAGDRVRAFAYGLLAAQRARRQLALETALEYWQLACRNWSHANSSVQFHIGIHRAETCMLLGRYPEGLGYLEDASNATSDPLELSRVDQLRGQTLLKQGAVGSAVVAFETGLRRLKVRVPNSLPAYSLSILRETLVQAGHSLFPRRFYQRDADVRTQLIIQLHNSLYHPLCFADSVRMLWSHLRGLNLSETLPASTELATSSATHGLMMAMLGWHSRAPAFMKRGTELANEMDDAWLDGLTHNYAGIGFHAAARFEEGIAVLDQAVASFERAGDRWQKNLAHFHRGLCKFMQGDSDEAGLVAKQVFADSVRIGDSRMMCAVWLWARVTDGDFPFDELKAQIPQRDDDIMSTVHALLAEGLWHSHHNRSDQALRVVERAAAMVRKSRCVNSHTILVLPMLTRMRRLRAAALASSEPALSKQLRRQSLRLARRSVWVMRLFPAARPLTWRELACVYRDLGRMRAARQAVRQSARIATRLQARVEQLEADKLAKQLAEP